MWSGLAALLLAGIVAAAVWLLPPGLMARGPGAELARAMDGIARVEVSRGDTRIVAVTADRQAWTLASAADAPADAAKLRAFLLDLSRLGDGGARTADPTEHALIGLGADRETRVVVRDAAGAVLTDIRFGDAVDGPASGRFARLGDAAQTFVATGAPELPRRQADWVVASLPSVGAREVVRMQITTPTLQRLVLARGPDQRFALEPLPAGAATNEDRAEAIASLFAGLSYTDVAAASTLAWNGASSFFITFGDGLDLSGLAMVRDGRAWLRVNASAPLTAPPEVRARADAINASKRLAFAIPEDRARLVMVEPADLVVR
jgi:hypothetical protein